METLKKKYHIVHPSSNTDVKVVSTGKVMAVKQYLESIGLSEYKGVAQVAQFYRESKVTVLPDDWSKIAQALRHVNKEVKSLTGEVQNVTFYRNGIWIYADDYGEAPDFPRRMDTNLLKEALGEAERLYTLPCTFCLSQFTFADDTLYNEEMQQVFEEESISRKTEDVLEQKSHAVDTGD